MSDLETRLRRNLDEHAAGLEVDSRPPPVLLARVRRRRQARGGMAAAVLLATLALGIVWVVVPDADRTELAAGRASDLLRYPPTLTGTVRARAEDCYMGRPVPECNFVRFGLGTPAMIEQVDNSSDFLPDGRWVARSDGDPQQWVLKDPGGAPPLPLGPPLPWRAQDMFGTLRSVKMLPDGRLVMLVYLPDGKVIRTVDPRSGSSDDTPVPRAVRWETTGLAVGPDGSIAVAGYRDEDATAGKITDLVVIRPDGKQRHHRLSWPVAPDGPRRFADAIDLSWGASGLLAMSPSSPVPPNSARFLNNQPVPLTWLDLHPGWTYVVDPATGDGVAIFDGWQGLAWSPDGQGLLLAQRDGDGASNLAAWWGPGLKERIDVGRVPAVVVPKTWTS